MQLQKQDPIRFNTKSQNQYPNIEAEKSDEIQPLEKHENKTVIFDDMLLSQQESNSNFFHKRTT